MVIENQGIQTDGRVGTAGGVADERGVTDCRVEITGGIAEERSSTDGRVPREIGRGDTVLERAKTDGRVAGAINVSLERASANCRVTDRGVASARVIVLEREIADRRVAGGYLLEPRAPAPLAVLKLPVVLRKERRKAGSGVVMLPCC